ncbi:MAG: NAD(P)/FAD-dependent oxidoreductase [Betaproteobacteria bacterium]|nr:NAD(P)/FAD-dependent oxidoreductase [Betaproteobacteria bacterium]
MPNNPSVCIIGAGPGGIAAGVMLRHKNITNFTIFEKASGPGGTWYHNRYPGAACDVQSKLYSFSFKPKYDWSRVNAAQSEILTYLEETAADYQLIPQCRFSTGITSLRWLDAQKIWEVTTDASEVLQFNVVITCVGLLNDPNWPHFPGESSYTGSIMHTARWRNEDLAGKKVAVVGTGSSAAQIVKSIAPDVAQLCVFQREPGWVIPNDDRAIDASEMDELRAKPLRARFGRWKLFWQRELAASVVIPGSKVHQARTSACLKWLDNCVYNQKTRAALTPNFPFNCKRPVRDPDYLSTFNRENVELVNKAVVAFTKHGLLAEDGIQRDADVVIMATGFKASSFLSTLQVTGRGGADLHECWEKSGGPEAFLGLCNHRFPNLFTFYGPNSNSSTGSIIFVLECQAKYVAHAIATLTKRGWRSLEVKEPAQRRFNHWLQRKASRTTWTGGCHNYYAAPSGKIVTNWPFSLVIYWLLLNILSVNFPSLFKFENLAD